MTVRYYIRCSGCKATILLRVSVSRNDEDQFGFTCERCLSKISCCHRLDQRRGRVKGFDLKGATRVEEQACEFAHTYSPDFANFGPATTGDHSLTPFIQTVLRRGSGLMTSTRRVQLLFD